VPDVHPAQAAQAARSRRHELASRARWRRRLIRPNGKALPGLTAVGRPRSTPEAEGVLKTQPTGGRAEQASNTARGTSERRRTCGYNNTDGGPARPPSRLEAATLRGPWVRRTPGVPRALGLLRWRIGRTPRAKPAPRERPHTSSPGLTRRSINRATNEVLRRIWVLIMDCRVKLGNDKLIVRMKPT
jgi:hypothetical protein